MSRTFEYFKDYLQNRGLRLTKQRAAIVKQFLAKKDHLCVDELYYILRRKHPKIGYTTVYRTLKLLKLADIASETNFTGKRKRFEPQYERPHHDHLICTKCGQLTEVVDQKIEQLQEKLAKRYRFKPTMHRMEIFGVCRNCR